MALYIYLALALFVYFFPTYLAFVRGHVDWKGVFFTNLAIAWTIVGWFVLFIWAFDVEKRN
ncbi:superinfection immunity protein [Candidatus Kaiserbacteria bacterium]|nr:superinfection immunity protein [Candidatus Kaiserbacteria bacterium]